LALRHQITVLERQLGEKKVRFTAPHRVPLAMFLHRWSPETLRRIRFLETVTLTWGAPRGRSRLWL
jgi:hypothetical protein